MEKSARIRRISPFWTGKGLPVVFPELPFTEKLRISPLTQDLVYADGHAVGKVQASGGGIADHGNPDAAVRMLVEQFFRQTGGFFPEKQVGMIGVLKHRMGMMRA